MRKLLLFLTLSAALPSLAAVSFTDPRWKIAAKESRVEQFLGRESLFLRNGIAWLDGETLRDGVIEVDIAAPADAGFHGVAFRAVDRENYEHFYLRSHLSKEPDATQYLPVFNGLSGWQIYSSARYTLPAEVVADRWVHVRMAVRGQRLEVSVDGQPLVFPQMVRPLSGGMIGLTAQAGPAHFCNFEFHAMDDPPMPQSIAGGDGAKPDTMEPGTIAKWRVSTPFPESKIDSIDAKSLQWGDVDAGSNGIANLAMLRRRDDANNTVFASTTIRSASAKALRLRFGFSDRVVVFLNGRPIYRGNDRFQTRDYRFLGTIGLFDELVLPLRAGDNELRFAVSEDLGGWAVIAQVVN
jgi:hypothetical protein